MPSWFGKLIGTDKALDVAETGLKGGMQLIDDAFHTDDEKAQHRIEITKNWIRTQELIGKESTPTAITRRVLAWGIFGVIIVIFAIGMYYLETGQVEKLTALKVWVGSLWLGEAFAAAWTTYFIKHIVK